MTPPVDDPDALRQILANTEALLLDFDGPICSVFAGVPAPVVAAQLRDVLAEGGHTDLPDDVRTATDPFDVLFYAAKLGQDEARHVEAAFRAHEVEAVQSAQPTTGSSHLISGWVSTGRRVAIVSNNSVSAVETYLDLHQLRADVVVISARSSSDITQLKAKPVLAAQSTQGAPHYARAMLACWRLSDRRSSVEIRRCAGHRLREQARQGGPSGSSWRQRRGD